MHLNKLDLNLFVLFRALMVHGSVTHAADTLSMTQSAVSHALARLRRHYGDELFRRSGSKMAPTSRALEMAPLIDAALKSIEMTFLAREFDPRSLQRQFRIGLVDFGALYLLPALLGKLATEAPGARVVVDHLDRSVALRRIERSELDLLIGMVGVRRRSLESITLFDDRFCVVAARNHPAVRSRISVDAMRTATYVRIPFFDRYESRFTKQGIKRKLAFSTDNLLSALSAVGRSELLAIMPHTIPRIYAGVYGVKSITLPFLAPSCVVELVYRRRDAKDAGHEWLRTAICDLAVELGSVMGTSKQLIQTRNTRKIWTRNVSLK